SAWPSPCSVWSAPGATASTPSSPGVARPRPDRRVGAHTLTRPGPRQGLGWRPPACGHRRYQGEQTTVSSSDQTATGVQSETGPQSDTGPAHRYGAALAGRIESRWQTEWAERGTFEAPNPVGPLAAPDGAAP